MQEAVIISGARTPTGSFGGALSGFTAAELGTAAAAAALKRSSLAPEQIGEVVFGAHLQAGLKANVARQVSLGSGIPDTTPAWTPNINCGTGLKAVVSAAQDIILGDQEIVLAGGTESMSRVPYLIQQHRFGAKMGNGELLDSLMYDALIDPFMNYHMGITAENVAAKCSITREMQDEFAYRSHVRATAARREGRFDDEMVPLEVKSRKGVTVVDKDETIREDASLEKLAAMRPAFKEGGTVTAGNASGINDGAAAVVMMSREKAKALGCAPRLTFRGYVVVGVHPSIMGYAPVPAIGKLMEKTGTKLQDIDLFELNEAFAAQAVACVKELGIDPEKVNVNGGAIALGHPVGCTGARLTVTLMHEMERRKARLGVVSLCIGGGQGIAVLWERG
ncbi:MAG: thiolase family protein [Synergistaceae bacterium]|jgi:acetyl-CoA C-acetyltransferase|nr:thiolase family protein [Synergistaceae bacterium]